MDSKMSRDEVTEVQTEFVDMVEKEPRVEGFRPSPHRSPTDKWES